MSRSMMTSLRERSTREWGRRLLVGVVLFGAQFGLLYLVVRLSEDTFYALSTSSASLSSDPMDAFVTGIIITNALIWILAISNIIRLIWSPRPAMIVAAVLLALLVMAYVAQWNPAGIILCVLGGFAWVVPVMVEWTIRRRKDVTSAALIMIAMSAVGTGACGEGDDRNEKNTFDRELEIDWAGWQRSCLERLSTQRLKKDSRYPSIHMHERNVERFDLRRFDTLTTLLRGCHSLKMDEDDVVMLYVSSPGHSTRVAALISDSIHCCVASRETDGLGYVSDDRYLYGNAEEAIERLWTYPQGSVGETDYDVIMMSRIVDGRTETRLWYLSDPIVDELAMDISSSLF